MVLRMVGWGAIGGIIFCLLMVVIRKFFHIDIGANQRVLEVFVFIYVIVLLLLFPKQRCPQCGAKYSKLTLQGKWTCPKCGCEAEK